MIIELTNLRPSPDLYFSRKLGWEQGDPPEDLNVPRWGDLRFFRRCTTPRDEPESMVEELGVRGDSIDPIDDGKRVRVNATITGELNPDSSHSPGEWIAMSLESLHVPGPSIV